MACVDRLFWMQEDERDGSRLKSVFSSAELRAEPSSVAVNALRHVVESNAGDELVRSLEQQDVWQRIRDDEKYWQGYIILARSGPDVSAVLLFYVDF